MQPSPVLTYQDQDELAQLVQLYCQRQPAFVLEIGSAYGGTLYQWLTNARPGAVVVSVDLPHVDPPADTQAWRGWAPAGVQLHLIEADSRQFSTLAEVAKHAMTYDFVFIDGGHDYDTAHNDWQFYGSLLAKGGLLAFDDIKPNDQSGLPCHVDRVWAEVREWAEALGYRTQEIIAHPEKQGNGLGLVFT